MPSYPLVFRTLEARQVERITPRMVRVTLAGPELEGFQSGAADDHIKVFFPLQPDGRPVMPPVADGAERSPSRDYTPRSYDPERGELTVDFVVHGSGPASTWADNAKPGDLLGVAGPRGSRIASDDESWYLFAGDETALPSIGRRLEELPAGARAVAVIEVATADEEQALQSAADVSLTWLHRNGAEAGTTSLLLNAIQQTEFPQGDGSFWLAGEAKTLRDVRRHLINERGIAREQLRFNGHWKRGTANHDHHEPIEE